MRKLPELLAVRLDGRFHDSLSGVAYLKPTRIFSLSPMPHNFRNEEFRIQLIPPALTKDHKFQSGEKLDLLG